jgi:signal peptidase I
MGDNRQNSTDSRYHQDLPSGGFVKQEYMVGRAIVVSWPFENWNWLDNYSATFGGVATK